MSIGADAMSNEVERMRSILCLPPGAKSLPLIGLGAFVSMSSNLSSLYTTAQCLRLFWNRISMPSEASDFWSHSVCVAGSFPPSQRVVVGKLASGGTLSPSTAKRMASALGKVTSPCSSLSPCSATAKGRDTWNRHPPCSKPNFGSRAPAAAAAAIAAAGVHTSSSSSCPSSSSWFSSSSSAATPSFFRANLCASVPFVCMSMVTIASAAAAPLTNSNVRCTVFVTLTAAPGKMRPPTSRLCTFSLGTPTSVSFL
mmetsp:Transcript_18866/g.37314  ORF Transcript_18866/g.37314 Transcript_18866/m.37314 type:complete len:255 (+) Transcript_18866:1887-2651(+)